MRSSSTLPWRPLRSQLRAPSRVGRVLLLVVAASLCLLHALLPSDRRAQVSEQLVNLSNALPALPGHGSFLQSWKSNKVDDPLVSLLETRLESTPPSAPYRLLLGTVQRSEGPALIEWVLHHLALGADHLVVFDSTPTPSSAPSSSIAAESRDLILPFVELGWVTLVRVEGSAAATRRNAINQFRRDWAEARARWSAFLDVNEYLVRREDGLDSDDEGESAESSSSAATALYDLLAHEVGAADGVELPRVWVTARPAESTSTLAGVLERHTALVTLDAQDAHVAPVVLAQSRAVDPSSASPSTPAAQGKPVIRKLSSERVLPVLVAERYPLHVRRLVRRARECPTGRQPAQQQSVVGDPALAALDRQACEAGGVHGVEEDVALVERGTSLAALGARLEGRWPVFRSEDYSLSVLPSPGSSKRVRLPLDDDEAPLEPGTTLVVESKHGGHPGFLEVILSTTESRRALAVTYLASGGAAFTLPPDTSRELVVAARTHANTTLTVVRQYAALPSPERDPPSPCSIMGHLKNQPKRIQLLQLADGACKGVDPAQVGALASATWPHAKYRGEVVLSRPLRLADAPEPAGVGAAAAAAPSPSGADDLADLTPGHWALHSLESLVASSRAEKNPQTRLYTTETCPRQFAPTYWDEQCGTHGDRLERDGVWRWVPDGARSYTDVALPADELRACLRADEPGRQAARRPQGQGRDEDEDEDDAQSERRRILVVGDSVSSHTFLALQCLVSTHLGVVDSARHVRFRNVQYEALDLVGATGSSLGRAQWDELLAWEWDAARGTATQYPHVVVLNLGLWPVSWGTASGYALGLRTALAHLAALAYHPRRNPTGPRILWRETTSVFPTKVPDPLFQVIPRVRLFNALAAHELAAVQAEGGGIDVLEGVYDMVSARADSARDSAHLCPLVQGDLAEVVMHRICRGGLLER
ncbi:hypothetical protein JCM9279_004796 [Rhodotorula babjevae]